MSIVAALWRALLDSLGFSVVSVAGEGPVDRTIPALALGAERPPRPGEIVGALADVDLVVVENALTIPMNLPASMALAETLRGRAAIIHHHDPPWQRKRFAHIDSLPVDDGAWRHVTINRLTEVEFRSRGVAATTIYNGIDVDRPAGDRERFRDRLGADDLPLLLHPVRAVARKDVPSALGLAEETGAIYWLTGPAEEGYGDVLDDLLARTSAPWRRQAVHGGEVADAYAAADAVLYPSTWEGFGIPPLEAAVFERPVVVGPYPVADELRSFGFRWLPSDSSGPLATALADPASLADDLAINRDIVGRHFSVAVTRDALWSLLDDAGWLPDGTRH